MALSCDPNDLIQASACLDCIPEGAHARVQTYLLCIIAGVDPTDPNALLKAANCMRCVDGMHAEVQTWLLCQIAGGT